MIINEKKDIQINSTTKKRDDTNIPTPGVEAKHHSKCLDIIVNGKLSWKPKIDHRHNKNQLKILKLCNKKITYLTSINCNVLYGFIFRPEELALLSYVLFHTVQIIVTNINRFFKVHDA